MKSNRILQLVLLVMIVVFVAAAGFLYFVNSNESKRYTELTDAINRNQAIVNKGVAEKAAKEKEATDLANQLASANALLKNADFRSSAESIEYDKILFSIAEGVKLQVANLSATASMDNKEDRALYQVTTFSISVESRTPETIFASTGDSAAYINASVSQILSFVNKVATSSDFDTTVIKSVNISAPKPMTDKDIKDKITRIKDIIKGKLTAEETQNKTDDEIAALVDSKLSTMSGSNIQLLVQQAGFDKTSAVITIEIWTYKGA